jgi:hypothetical protein
MARVQILPTEDFHLPGISDLTHEVFGLRRPVSLLQWLLANPYWPDQVDSWVMVSNERVVGHTAVLKCSYVCPEGLVTGAHAFLWMVLPEFRGRASVGLGVRISEYDDFLLILGGSATTKTILAGRNFTQATEAREYRFSPRGASQDRIDLVPGAPGSDSSPSPTSVVANCADPRHLRWLADCPELESHRFTLHADGEAMGEVQLFVNHEPSTPSGRLVHIPYLGHDPAIWIQALIAVGFELEKLGCGSVSLLATHPALVEAAEEMGAEITGLRPVWMKERSRSPSGGPWHLTYLEGDLAYRRV